MNVGRKKISVASEPERHRIPFMTTADISKLSVSEKLKLMDALWEDLSATPERIESPDWHREELEKTAERRRKGLEPSMSLDEARRRLLEEKK